MDSKEKKVFNSRPLFYGFIVLLIALASARNIFVGKTSYVILFFVIVLALMIYFFWAKKYVMLIFILGMFLFGLGWYYVGCSTYLGKTYDTECVVTGRITDKLNNNTYNQTTTLHDVTINGQKEKNVALQISYDSEFDNIEEGDIISFVATVQPARLYELGKFNFNYYRDKSPYVCVVRRADVTKVGSKLKADEKFRLYVKDILYKNMGEKNGATAYACLFGDKSEIEAEVKDAYKSSGIVHILTVSGLHVSFLIVLLGWILKKCKVRGLLNFFICLAFLIVYSYLCGFAPSIVRAGIMGLVLLGAKLTGKCYDGLNSIGLAGLIILIYRPLFANDVGFLMSFFCVISIYVISPVLSKFFKKFLPNKIAEAFSISISTSIGISPFFGEMFSSLNCLSFFVNLIVVPLFSILFPLLFVLTLISAGIPIFGVLLKVCGFGFDVILKIAGFFASTKLYLPLETMDILLICFMMIFLFLSSRFFMAKPKAKLISLGCCFVAFILTFGAIKLTPAKSSINYCYNYNSCAIMLVNSDGNAVFVDGGDYAFNRRLLNSAFANDADALICLNSNPSSLSGLNNMGFDKSFVLEGKENFDEQTSVAQDEIVSFKGFEFRYRFEGGGLAGLEISFDDCKIFVCYSYASEVRLEPVSENSYDFVLTGKNLNCVDKFSQNSRVVLTYSNSPYSKYNYSKDGNISIGIKNGKLKRRYID